MVAGGKDAADGVAEIVRQIERDDSLVGRMARIVRLALPPNAVVAVASRGDDALLDVGASWAHHFPRLRPEVTRHLSDLERLAVEVEMIVGQDVSYLMIPAGAEEWLGQPFLDHLREHYRLVVEEPGTCVVFALQELSPSLREAHVGPDGLPLPPLELIRLTAGLFDEEDILGVFFEGGALDAGAIRRILGENGLDMAGLQSMLDFGCGCGRVLRQWHELPAAVSGSDYNPYLIDWCKENLSFAKFTVNGVAPPLEFEDDSFDFVYAVSVFTHFLEPLQHAWAAEMKRILRPGGHLLLTLNGLPQTWVLDEQQRAAFESGEFVSIWSERAGTNICTAFHPDRYLRETFAPSAGLRVVDVQPEAMPGAHQDGVLFKNP